MKVAERILLILILIGVALKFAHIPGGGALSILSISITSFFYLIGSYFLFDPKKSIEVSGTTYYKASSTRVVVTMLTGLSLNIALVGLLFKLMHWPGAAVMLIFGLLGLLPITIISVIKYSRLGDDFFKQIAIRNGVLMVICALLFFYRFP